MSALAGIIGAVGTSVANAGFDMYNAYKQRQQNEHLMDKGNAWDLMMWNKTNEYNAPVNQIERLREAGLNPLYYGLDGSSANSVESVQPLAYQRATAPLLNNPVDAAYEARLKESQISNIDADTAQKGEETLTEVERRNKLKAECETEKQKLINMRSEKDLTDAQKAEIDLAIKWYDKIQETQITKAEEEAKYTKAQRERLEQLLPGELLEQSKSIEEFEKRWNMWLAQAAKDYALAGLTQADIENYGINHFSNGVGGSGLSLQNFIRNRFLNYDGSPKKPSELAKTWKEEAAKRREKRNERRSKSGLRFMKAVKYFNQNKSNPSGR